MPSQKYIYIYISLKILSHSLVQKRFSLFSNKLPWNYCNQVSNVRLLNLYMKNYFLFLDFNVKYLNKNPQFTTPQTKSNIFRCRKIRNCAINRLSSKALPETNCCLLNFKEAYLLYIKFLKRTHLPSHFSTFSTLPLQSTI